MVTIVLGIFMLASVCQADERPPLKDLKVKESYSLGYDFGSNLKQQEIDVDIDVLLAAVRDALEGKKGALEPGAISDTLKQLRKRMFIVYNRRKEELAARSREEGRAFLAANKAKEGVTTLPSGLQYKVLRDGTGPNPQTADKVKIRYRGTLMDGSEFDSSYDRGEPATVRVNGVIRGWAEALQRMKTGAKWQLFVPAELAYGERQFGRIPPNSTLIFEIELLSIEQRDTTSHKAGQKPAGNDG
jgi:FKBP-type peptidyl-prolyl cis-trans isomerase